MKTPVTLLLALLGVGVAATAIEPANSPPTPAIHPKLNGKPRPIGVVFQKHTLRRVGDHGDNWCLTWAADDSQITSMCDGDWLGAGHGYQPKLSPKWMSRDGQEMVLIWSDAMKNKEGKSHTVNYRWNQMRIRLQVK